MFRKRTEKLLSGMGFDPGALSQVSTALNPANLRAQANYRAAVQRLMATGVEVPATIVSFTPGSGPAMGGGQTVHLHMEVAPPHGVAYSASFDQVLPQTIVSTLAAGQRVTVKVAADDPQTLMLWNTPHAAGGADPDTGRPLAAPGASAADDRITRLEKLQQMRSSGALSEDEFQTLKAKLLASED
jgi:hypothetical protein